MPQRGLKKAGMSGKATRESEGMGKIHYLVERVINDYLAVNHKESDKPQEGGGDGG
jgi:hypothetical protein